MKSRQLAFWTIVALVAVGAACVGMRVWAVSAGRLSSGHTTWRVAYDITFSAQTGGAKFRIALPDSAQHVRVSRETFSRPAALMDVVRNRMTGGREAVIVAATRLEGARFAAQFDVLVDPAAEPPHGPAKEVLSAAGRAHFLQADNTVQLDSPGVRRALGSLNIGARAKQELLEGIFEYCSEDIAHSPGGAGPWDAAGALERGAAAPLGRARAMVALCRAAKLPARLVAGFVLEERHRAQPHVWVEVYRKKQWLPYDPENGYSGRLPPNYLPVRRDGTEIVRSHNACIHEKTFAVSRLMEPPGVLNSLNHRPSSIVDLTRLSPGMQETLMVLLLLPVAGLITAVFRNLVGVQTFGTFTPSLLALSFLYADWRTGALVFVFVMAIGLGGRALLGRLRLLAMPRLGVILTLVVLCLAVAVSAFDYLGWTPSARAVLLPTVILTMMIERFQISVEEDGIRHSLGLLAGTLAVAFACLLMLRAESLGRLALTFPEGQLFVAAALVMVGRYTGYRVVELRRFRDIGLSYGPKGQK